LFFLVKTKSLPLIFAELGCCSCLCQHWRNRPETPSKFYTTCT